MLEYRTIRMDLFVILCGGETAYLDEAADELSEAGCAELADELVDRYYKLLEDGFEYRGPVTLPPDPPKDKDSPRGKPEVFALFFRVRPNSERPGLGHARR